MVDIRQWHPWNAALDDVFGFDPVPGGRIVRNRLRHLDRRPSKKRCDGVLVSNSLEYLAGETRNADDSGRQVGEGQAYDAIVAAAFHLRDGYRSAETNCYAEVVDFTLEC